MTPQISQGWALRLQLATIAGNEPVTSLFEVRAKRSTGRMDQLFVGVHELDRAAAAIVNRSQLVDVYVGAAPRTRREGTLDAIERVWSLWADCDNDTAVERLRHFKPLPSIVLRSGTDNRVHAYWPLNSPIPPSWAQRANLRLAHALGSDKGATDGARIMRPIGSRNHKHDPARPVECVRLEMDVFTVDLVVGRLCDDRDWIAPAPRPLTATAAGGGSLPGLVRVVREAQDGNRNNALNWAAYKAGRHVLAGAVDEFQGRDELRQAGLDAGLSELEVDRTIRSAMQAGADAA